MVHRRLKDLAKPPLLMWTDVLACLDCGFTEFTLGEEELRLLSGSDDVPELLLQLPIDAPDFFKS